MRSKTSNHEMTWLNPQLQNFHFYQSDKFSAKSLCWQASSSQCWRLSWCFFCVSCWTGCISFFISFFYRFLIKSFLKCFMHTKQFLIGFHSDRLSHLIYLVNWSGLLKRKENPSTCWCFLLYSELQPETKHLLTILPCTTVKAYSM